jgi:hypothetical protein
MRLPLKPFTSVKFDSLNIDNTRKIREAENKNAVSLYNV